MWGIRIAAKATLVVAVVAASLGGIVPARAQEEPLRVVVTFSILADLVEQTGGDLIEVDTLVPANVDAHAFEPSPEQVAALTEAAVIFENGVGFEPWLDDMIDAAQPNGARVAVSEGVALRAPGETSDDDEDHEGERDPHIWHDADNAVIMVENIRDALIAADPDHAAEYEERAAAYIAELEALDAWIIEQVATLPAERRKLVTSHDTFGYYADRYGFTVIGAPFGTTTEGGDPSAGDVAALIEAIEEAGVPAIFTENVSNQAVMEQIAENAGVALAPPLYTDALGEEGSPGATYLGMMRSNTETIVGALSS
jgi:ABC-type Zn uptake system ZnuABC Zn-binding protein ZnuA